MAEPLALACSHLAPRTTPTLGEQTLDRHPPVHANCQWMSGRKQTDTAGQVEGGVGPAAGWAGASGLGGIIWAAFAFQAQRGVGSRLAVFVLCWWPVRGALGRAVDTGPAGDPAWEHVEGWHWGILVGGV